MEIYFLATSEMLDQRIYIIFSAFTQFFGRLENKQSLEQFRGGIIGLQTVHPANISQSKQKLLFIVPTHQPDFFPFPKYIWDMCVYAKQITPNLSHLYLVPNGAYLDYPNSDPNPT